MNNINKKNVDKKQKSIKQTDPSEIESLLDKLSNKFNPDSKESQIFSALIASRTVTRPHISPEDVREYNNAEPGLGNSLINNFIEESKTRRAETTNLYRYERQKGWFTSIVATIVLLGATYLSYDLFIAGHDVGGSVMLGVPLIGLLKLMFGFSKKNPIENSIEDNE